MFPPAGPNIGVWTEKQQVVSAIFKLLVEHQFYPGGTFDVIKTLCGGELSGHGSF